MGSVSPIPFTLSVSQLKFLGLLKRGSGILKGLLPLSNLPKSNPMLAKEATV